MEIAIASSITPDGDDVETKSISISPKTTSFTTVAQDHSRQSLRIV